MEWLKKIIDETLDKMAKEEILMKKPDPNMPKEMLDLSITQDDDWKPWKPIERINELENSQLKKSIVDESIYTKTPKELTSDELEFLIEKLIEDEKNAKYNKGRRMIKKSRIELETELEKRN